ncbi:hypothetical protein [Bacillus wiedmannii]|uniref:hypothetical protein n=1 Tax=Bacillus wiedmannii TaxID=1890302 RepID=UPI000BF22E2E|nr:hypothetical protein [Bacillus wiedmannii]MDP1459842.1 hypothetical protein [Bacillus wiedmannii]PEJ62377.1 hypothetical protein CN685_26285 [Bacillus wiedmannii]
MNPQKIRIRILDLQDKYCQMCEYQMNPLKECIQQRCEVGKELKSLANLLFMESLDRRPKEKWDDWCYRAKELRENGWSYPKIAQYLKIPTSNLRNQMRKRGFDSKGL